MGYSMEPSKEAFEKAFDDAYARLEIDDSRADSYQAELRAILLNEKDASPEMAAAIEKLDQELDDYSDLEFTALAQDVIKPAMLAAARENSDKIAAFRDAISFSTVLFWIMAVMVGTVQGGIQAVSRSYFGKLIPKKQSNEYYGFFDIFGKFAAFMGPFIYATVGQLSGRSSYGVLGLSLLFVIGLVLLIVGGRSMEADERMEK
ncbi:MAG: MFS transporter [Clostridia bacterium]|nr:MFS transporter [Clostridia bacterium]